MKNSKYGKVLTIVLILVVLLIIGLLIFWIVNSIGISQMNEEQANASNAYIESKDKDKMADLKEDVKPQETTKVEIKSQYDEDSKEEENADDQVVQTIAKASVPDEYKGFPVKGVIEIPKNKKKMPILADANKKALEASVAILYGVGLNQVGNTVIVGHNYRNGTFFSDNYKLSIGDKIYITDETGQRLTYKIYDKYQTEPEDANYAMRDTQGKIEITLSTCTDDSAARTIILARVEDNSSSTQEA